MMLEFPHVQTGGGAFERKVASPVGYSVGGFVQCRAQIGDFSMRAFNVTRAARVDLLFGRLYCLANVAVDKRESLRGRAKGRPSEP